jgi:hypothetical protein
VGSGGKSEKFSTSRVFWSPVAVPEGSVLGWFDSSSAVEDVDGASSSHRVRRFWTSQGGTGARGADRYRAQRFDRGVADQHLPTPSRDDVDPIGNPIPKVPCRDSSGASDHSRA